MVHLKIVQDKKSQPRGLGDKRSCSTVH